MSPLRLWLLPLLLGILFSLTEIPKPNQSEDEPVQSDDVLYQRMPSGSIDNKKCAEIIFVGDIMLGRQVNATEKNFSAIDRLLSGADLTVGNLESVAAVDVPLTVLPSDDVIILEAPKRSAAVLQNAGFDILSIANNHALDKGLPAMLQTYSRLESSGIEAVGLNSHEARGNILIKKVNGLRIAFIAINAVPGVKIEPEVNPFFSQEYLNPSRFQGRVYQDLQISSWNPDRVLGEIEYANKLSDIVVVSVHWGDEYSSNPTSGQKRAAQAIVEAGADLVIGHHPHVIQPSQVIEFINDSQKRHAFVAYSLGNFIFDQADERTKFGLALKVLVNSQGISEIQALPLVAGTMPKLVSGNQANRILAKVQPTPRLFIIECEVVGCETTEIQPLEENRNGLFWSGASDLTGDGSPEIIRRVEESLSIFEQEKLVWQSPASWKVVDAALGDPNDDGREEVLVALNKDNQQGVTQSHPFIIGYRGGIYRQIWGGSAVKDRIIELELGDVFGDKAQELVVLEERAQGKTAVSVWTWNGWGFTLHWRSQDDLYKDLSLLDMGDHRAIAIEKPWKSIEGDLVSD